MNRLQRQAEFKDDVFRTLTTELQWSMSRARRWYATPTPVLDGLAPTLAVRMDLYKPVTQYLGLMVETKKESK